jgi:hypothetical protein
MIAWGLDGLGWAAGGRAQVANSPEAAVRATRLMGAAEALFEPPLPLPPPRRTIHDRTVDAARAALGEEAFAAAWAEGRELTLDQAISCALEAGGA